MPLRRPRYVSAPRLSWVPPRFVVVDADTGRILSKHATEGEAETIAEGMNSSHR